MSPFNNVSKRIFILAILLLIQGCGFRNTGGSIYSDTVRGVKDTAKNEVAWSSLQGKWVLLNFWASWCNRCVEELTTLGHLRTLIPDESFLVLAVAVDDEFHSVKALDDINNFPIPLLIDTEGSLKKAFQVRGLPATFLLNPEGEITKLKDPQSGELSEVVIGFRDWSSKSALESISQATGRRK